MPINKKCACQGSFLDRFIQPAILALLAQEDDYGYSILVKLSRSPFFAKGKPDVSGTYRTLREMEKRGLLSSRIVLPDHENMGKRIFTITAEGRDCLAQWRRTLGRYQADIALLVAEIDQALG